MREYSYVCVTDRQLNMCMSRTYATKETLERLIVCIPAMQQVLSEGRPVHQRDQRVLMSDMQRKEKANGGPWRYSLDWFHATWIRSSKTTSVLCRRIHPGRTHFEWLLQVREEFVQCGVDITRCIRILVILRGAWIDVRRVVRWSSEDAGNENGSSGTPH